LNRKYLNQENQFFALFPQFIIAQLHCMYTQLIKDVYFDAQSKAVF